jgi:hypothetical protein
MWEIATGHHVACHFPLFENLSQWESSRKDTDTNVLNNKLFQKHLFLALKKRHRNRTDDTLELCQLAVLLKGLRLPVTPSWEHFFV